MPVMCRALAALLLLAGQAVADEDVDISNSDSALQEDATMEALPMYMYKRDCWKKRPISLAQEDMHRPGAGMDKITPFKQVLKDGFYQVDCVKDYMFEFGDKHGNNKFSYKLEDIANVSIVRYDDVVPKEDRDKMTHTTCFALCRTVPDMLFFGIRRGGTCYCAPYYKPSAGDSSMCDSVCEGDGSQMCGGESKSSVFQMHSCNNIAGELSGTASKMEDIQGDMKKLVRKVKASGNDMQDAGDELYAAFNGMGDASGARNIQKAKVRAGVILHSVEEAEELDGEMDDLKSDSDDLKGKDFSLFAKAEEAETTTRKMKKAISKASKLVDELQDMYASAHVRKINNDTTGAVGQYLPALYFVNKDDMKYSSTCGGKNLGEPILGTLDDCAAACDTEFVGDCSGFSFMGSSKLNNEVGLCFVLAHFKEMTWYPKCGKGDSFLQMNQQAVPSWVDNTKCMAKLSEFNGLSLKPDPSGKNKYAFRKVRKSRECFK